MGLSQGAGSAPPSYLAVSTVAITAYKRKNYHPVLCSAITGCLFSLAAALFVDDTDQFHLAKDNQSEDNFVRQVQAAITFWGMIVLATGGYLKQSKCQVYPVLFRFIHGRAIVKKPRFMPNHQFTIPQKGGMTVTILTVDQWSATKSLGVMYNVMNICKHQVQFISDKGIVWTSRLNLDAHIGKRDAWKSFFFQLQPSLSYSIVAVSADPKSLAKAQDDIFHDSLSRLHRSQPEHW